MNTPAQRLIRSFILLSLILLIIIAGCTPDRTPLPEPDQPEAVQGDGTPRAEAPPAPEAADEPLPPIVLYSAPERGEEQDPAAPIEIVFDQPMDRDSVEKAFAIEPGASVDGIFEWVDDQTVRFAFNDGFERDERYKVRVITSAKSQAGLEMQRPFELRFSTVGYLEVGSVQPADGATEILPDSIVTVLFNRPVVPLNAIEDAASLPDPLTFVPPVTGEGEWLNTSIYQFTPAGDGFEPSTQYTARVSQGLSDALDQTELADDFEWTFSTVTPAVIGSIPAAGDLYVSPTPVISLTFNQPMDRPSVEANFILENSDTGAAISGEFVWIDGPLVQPAQPDDINGYYDYTYAEGEGPVEIGIETVSFIPDVTLDFDTVYQVGLAQGARGGLGEAETQSAFSASFTVTPFPAVLNTFPAAGDEGIDPWQSFEITFNAPMNPDSFVFGRNLVIEPSFAVTQVYSYWGSTSNTELYLSFPSRASSDYTVTLGPDLEGRYGQQLGVPATVSWATRAEDPLLYLHTPGRIASYNAYSDTLIFASVRNISQVDFGLYHLSQDDFIRLNDQNWWEVWDNYQPRQEDLIAAWTMPTSPFLNSNIIYRVDLAEQSGLGDLLPPGLYYLVASYPSDAVYPEARSTNVAAGRDHHMLVVSRNNITFKSASTEALAWLTDLQSGQPVVDVPMTFITNEDTVGVDTNADGVAASDYARLDDAYETRFAFAGDPDNPAENFAVALNNWTDGIERYQFDNISVEDYQQPYTAHFYTDRTIYRPGQTVFLKGIIRADDDARYSLPAADRNIKLVIRDSQGKEIFSADLPLSEFGTVNGAVELDENAALGYYTVEAQYDEQFYYDEFQVAAYRAPEFLVEVTTDQPEYAQGEMVRVTARAEFFFGGPVSNADVRWTLLSDDFYFNYQGKGFYDFTDYDFSRQNFNNYFPGFGEQMAEGEGVTDADGRFTFEVEADIAAKIASQRFTLDVVVTDLNNQEVASQAQAIVHKGLIYVGLQPVRYVGQVGEETEVNVLTVDWESQPVANQEVQVVFAEHNWYSVQRQYEDGSFYWDSVVESVPVFTTTVTTDVDGRALAAFIPEKGGIYRALATATDHAGNEVHSSTFMWVSGREFVNWRQENNDRLELVADQREYNVGDTATILVPHPYSGTVQALVTLERGHIYDHFVTELPTNSELLEIPITEDMVPNMYVSVTVVKGVDEANQLPSFKVGYASLPINTSTKELQITLTPNKPAAERYQPGETAEYHLNVTNAHGQPVKAELSLALVDKAVLSLSPETPGQLFGAFWRNRGLAVQTGGGLTLAIDRINLLIAPEAKGGGGGFDEGFGVIRGDFRDTALWLADFVTDENGEGVIETELPDNLTTWTMTGKGVTGADTLAGEATVDIVSTKPLLVRAVAPRFFVVDDEALLGLIVQNNTDETQDVEARFEAEGVEIGEWRLENGDWVDDETPGLTVEPGERVKLEFQVTVGDAAAAQLTMGAKSAGYGDALTFELPVYRFSTPETVATVGILEEDGARLEAIALPRSFDPTQGDLTIDIDPSLAAGMRDGLDYLEHFTYECTEQTVSRFLPNVFTYRAYQQLGMANETQYAQALGDKLPGLVSVGLQRLINQQHFDGGWGWWITDKSDPFLTAYVLLGLVEARRTDFAVDQQIIDSAVDYLEGSLVAPKDVDVSWRANRQAFILYVLAEAGSGDLGRSVALFNEREKLDIFGRAYLAMGIHLLDEQADQIATLLDDITSSAIVSATGAHWEEAQVDYYAMNTDTRSTAIIIAALARIQPDNAILPNAVRWLMSVRENGGHWETTQETAWALIGLTDWMVVTGELEGNYAWQVSLNGESLGDGSVDQDNIDETTRLQVEVQDLLADAVNRLAIERDPLGGAVSGSPGRLYYGAYLTYFKPVEEVKALDRGIIVSRQYRLVDDEDGQPISAANVGDVIEVKITVIAPNDLHYVVVEDPLPAGAEGIDASLATTSVVGEQPELSRTDRSNPWGPGYGWWYFSHTELRDEKAVLFATFLPKGTYEYTYQIRASLPGEYRVIPTHAAQMYFPEVFGRGDGGVFRIGG
jgi:hypothetical protein